MLDVKTFGHLKLAQIGVSLFLPTLASLSVLRVSNQGTDQTFSKINRVSQLVILKSFRDLRFLLQEVFLGKQVIAYSDISRLQWYAELADRNL